MEGKLPSPEGLEGLKLSISPRTVHLYFQQWPAEERTARAAWEKQLCLSLGLKNVPESTYRGAGPLSRHTLDSKAAVLCIP